MAPVRILLLSFYFTPDISAGAFRCSALVKKLSKSLPCDSELIVLTTAPNRIEKQRIVNGDYINSPEENVKVIRLSVSGGGRGVFLQSSAFASYACQVRRITNDMEFDLVIASSSRLMTAVLARWVAKRAGALLYQDIRDNFVDNLPFMLPLRIGHLLSPLFSGVERWALKKSNKINLVSRGFENYFRTRYPDHCFSWHTNGIDPVFIEALEAGAFEKKPCLGGGLRLKVLYAGNLGIGQGLEHVLPELAKRLDSYVEFKIIGDGAGRKGLCRALSIKKVNNVELIGTMSREELLEAYREADILFLHLNNLPSLESVLPSKLFEYATTGKPIWAGVPGFAADFIAKEIENATCFSPCDINGAIVALQRLKVTQQPRYSFVDRWKREKIMMKMADDIVELVKNGT